MIFFFIIFWSFFWDLYFTYKTPVKYINKLCGIPLVGGLLNWVVYKVNTPKIITRFDNTPYLLRYTLFKCPWFSVKVHRILESDDACLHDHPWAFISIIIAGGYTEVADRRVYWRAKTDGRFPVNFKRVHWWYGPGSILFRRAEYRHRLVVTQPATTLVITFKRFRRWGFFTPSGWIEWFNYEQNNSETCE